MQGILTKFYLLVYLIVSGLVIFSFGIPAVASTSISTNTEVNIMLERKIIPTKLPGNEISNLSSETISQFDKQAKNVKGSLMNTGSFKNHWRLIGGLFISGSLMLKYLERKMRLEEMRKIECM